MEPRYLAIALVCIAAIFLSGCTTQNPGPVTPVPTAPAETTITSAPATTAPATTGKAVECTRASDCIPAECCHASACIAGPRKTPCTVLCTMVCSGPLDCGAGSCGCVKGRCSVVPSAPSPGTVPGISLVASPPRYSPVMSSTPGIALEPVATGFNPRNATFTWNASYGHFLSWNAPDYRVNELGSSATNHGEQIYWSFLDRPASPAQPVTITVTASDTGTGRVIAEAVLDLAWDGDYAVIVQG